MKEKGRSVYLTSIEKAAGFLLLVYPTLMLAVKGGMNGTFLLMLLLVLAVWIVRPAGIGPTIWKREWTVYAVSMVAMTAAIFASQSYHQNYSASPYDGASRYWLAIPVFLFLRRLDLRSLAMLQFAFPLAAITGFLLAKEIKDLTGRMGVQTLDVIHFGDFELILGVLSLLGINWFGHDKSQIRIFKMLGFIAGTSASFLSGSRGGWVAIPVFVIILVHLFTTAKSLKTLMFSAIAAALISSLLYFANSTLQQRMNELAYEIVSLEQGNKDSSTGIRLQLYRAAIDMFLRHPAFGVGPGEFAQEMQPMMEAKKITPSAAEMGRGEVHNDILCKTAGMGVFGLAAILSIYFVPMWLFWRATKSDARHVRRAGILGVVFVTGFFVFGLTVEILNLTMAIAFYSFTVAALLAVCYNIHSGKNLSEQATSHV